jgi:hypothetical protein
MYSERDEFYKKSKKPDQNFYHSKQQQQQQGGIKSDSSSSAAKRYEVRQTSESRSSNYSSNNNNQQERAPKMTLPPSGQQQQQQLLRINNAAFKNLPMNIDSLPPRLKRKYLKDAGLPEELADKPIIEIQQQFSYSLPYVNHQGGSSSGASRYNQQPQRYDQYHNQNNSNFQSKYNNNNNQNHHHTYHSQNERNISHHRSRSITPTRPPLSSQLHQKQSMTRNEWKSNNNHQQQHVELTPPKNEKEGSSFDWSEDVLNSHSLPHDVNTSPSSKVDDRSHNSKYDDQNHRQRNRRRRNRRLVEFFAILQINSSFKLLFDHAYKFNRGKKGNA